MGSYKNTDNLGRTLHIGDRVGYIYGHKDHYRIHSGTVKQLCEKRVWIEPDDVFSSDARYTDKELNSDWFVKWHPNHKYSEKDHWYLAPYGRVVYLGY